MVVTSSLQKQEKFLSCPCCLSSAGHLEALLCVIFIFTWGPRLAELPQSGSVGREHREAFCPQVTLIISIHISRLAKASHLAIPNIPSHPQRAKMSVTRPKVRAVAPLACEAVDNCLHPHYTTRPPLLCS